MAVWSPPDLYVATTTSGADISSLTLNVGQTGQIILIQEFANPAPTFSVVTQPPSGGVSVNPTTGLVTYTPPWARPEATTNKHPPEDVADYARFAAAAARSISVMPRAAFSNSC